MAYKAGLQPLAIQQRCTVGKRYIPAAHASYGRSNGLVPGRCIGPLAGYRRGSCIVRHVAQLSSVDIDAERQAEDVKLYYPPADAISWNGLPQDLSEFDNSSLDDSYEEEEGEDETPTATLQTTPDVEEEKLLAAQQEQQQQPQSFAAGLSEVPHSIVVISTVSMCLTLASCIFNSLMPVYMVTELKMNMSSMGVFEGLLEAFSYFVRMLSGIASDLMVNRKNAIIFGFGLSAMAKFGMSMSGSVTQLFLGKAVDKVANGIQAAPRDALIGDLAPENLRSSCFGFAQSLRKWGSTLGACLAFVLMKVSNNNYKLIFTLAASISAASCIAFAVLVPAHPRPQHQPEQPLASAPSTSSTSSPTSSLPAPHSSSSTPLLSTPTVDPDRASSHAAASTSSTPQPASSLRARMLQFGADLRSMGSGFYRMLSVVVLYGLGHIGESLLEMRAVEVGFGKAESTLVIALLAFMVFMTAYPIGKLDDKYGSRTTFALGMSALIAGDVVLMFSGQWPYAVFAACLLWGVHWAVVQGPLLSMVVQLSPPRLRGTAFGIFYTVMAATAVVANTSFGHVWHHYGAVYAFGLSAAIVSVTLALLPKLLPDNAGRQSPQPSLQPVAA